MMGNILNDNIQAIKWHNNALELLDQRLLPARVEYLRLEHVNEVADAIRNMVVRGAPAIGITAAYGVVIAATTRYQQSATTWKQDILDDIHTLAQSRPTAVNLFWALDHMKQIIDRLNGDPSKVLLDEAANIHRRDIEANHAMGRYGAALIDKSCAVLTHCNTGSLATGGFGTALGVIRQAYNNGNIKQVFADETRPWLQGSRLTAWELSQDRIPVSLIVEGAAAHLLKQGEIAWIIVGADRIAANGDVANKIGTYGLAILARYHHVKFMVAAPTTTIDMAMVSGEEINIEQRPGDEILSFGGQSIYEKNSENEGSHAWNPAFDITPFNLIDALVTEKGAIVQPNHGKLVALMKKE